MDQDGNVLSVEQEMAWSELPGDVQKDFSNVTGKGKLEAVSSVSREGKIVAYESTLATNGKRAHVRVVPNAPAPEEAIPGPGTK